MYNVSSTYLNKIKEPSRLTAIKVGIGDKILTNLEVQNLSVEYSSGNDGLPAIGGATAAKLTLSLLRVGNTPSYYTTQSIKPSIAIDDGVGNLMWVPLGTFYADPESIKRTDQTISIDCFDMMKRYESLAFESSLSYPASLKSVAGELTSKYGLVFADITQLPNANIKTKPTGSIRNTLSEMAELATANCLINRDNKIEFRKFIAVDFSLDINNYIDFSLKSDSNVKISKLVCKKDGDNPNLEYGDITGSTLEFENDSVSTVVELKTIYDRMYPFSYPSYNLKAQGMPHLECGDVITLTDKKNIVRRIPIVSHKISYNGGIISEFSANVPKTNNSTGSNGSNSITNAIKEMVANYLIVNEILAGNITADNIKANSITADRIDAKTMTAESGVFDNLVVDSAHIADGAIDSAKIDIADISAAIIKDLKVGTAQIEDAAITNLKVKDVDASKINAGDISADRIKTNVINAINAYIGSAVIDIAKIGELTADKIAANVIAAINLSAEVAKISSAKIGDLSAEKITSGSIDTERLKANIIKAINLTTDTATIDSAKIGNLSADIITSGDINTERLIANVIKAINLDATSATINSAKIGNLSADKITSGSMDTERLKANVISAINAYVGAIKIKQAQIETLKVGNANITDASISGAKIEKASITNAQIADATIESAKIKEVYAKQIKSGTVETGELDISSIDGTFNIKGNTLQIKDNQTTPKVRIQIGKDSRGYYGILVLNSEGNAIFDSDKGVLIPAGLADNVVSESKIVEHSIGPTRLNIDQLFVGDNAFINQLKAVQIDASNIVTGTISNERINLKGLISFDMLNQDLQPVFDVKSGKTYINGGMIATNTIKADKIDLLSGITVKGPDNTNTFSIADTGQVEVNGLLHSGNYDDQKGTGYEIRPDGTATLNQATIRGNVILPNAGITNYADDKEVNPIRIWAGASYENRDTAPFRVLQNGNFHATNAILSGMLFGSLDNEDLTIKDGVLTIGGDNTYLGQDGNVAVLPGTELYIKFSKDESIFNSNVTFGPVSDKRIEYNNENRILSVFGTEVNINSYVRVNKNRSLDIGHKNINEVNNTLVIDNQGGQGSEGDFKFTRQGGKENVKVVVDGEVSVKDKITSKTNGIEMRAMSDGWGFYAI